VEGAALEEWVVFYFLKASGGADAFLVTGGDVTGGGTAFCLGFRAFEDDDIAWHKLVRMGVGR
jgi:hypothetical protein